MKLTHFDDFRGKLEEQLSRTRRGWGKARGRKLKTEAKTRQLSRGLHHWQQDWHKHVDAHVLKFIKHLHVSVNVMQLAN